MDFFQLSELKAKHAQCQEQIKQKTVRLEYMETTMKQQEQDLRKRLDQVAEFEKVCEEYLGGRGR
jgi:Ni,Fe-hydrogenase I small subunit